MKLDRGTQIIYLPTEAHGEVDHPNCETGFVTSVLGDVAFCRYWSKSSPEELQNKLGGVATYIRDLIKKDTVPQADVEAALDRWCK